MRFDGVFITNLRGKLGGIVGSRNGAGQFLRVLVRSVQPNSIAQLAAKANFSVGASIFRALSGLNKALWNGFSKGIFSPKDSTNTGQYNGQQACQSLSTSFTNSIAKDKAFTVKVNDAVLAGGETFDSFQGPQDAPPVATINSNLTLQAGGSVAQSLLSATIALTGLFSFKMQIGDGAGNDITSWENASGADIGYAIFMSTGNPSSNMAFKSLERYLLGYFKHVSATVEDDLDAANDFEFTATDPFLIAEHKQFPSVGQTVLISVYAVDVNNQMSLVGRVETTLTA